MDAYDTRILVNKGKRVVLVIYLGENWILSARYWQHLKRKFETVTAGPSSSLATRYGRYKLYCTESVSISLVLLFSRSDRVVIIVMKLAYINKSHLFNERLWKCLRGCRNLRFQTVLNQEIYFYGVQFCVFTKICEKLWYLLSRLFNYINTNHYKINRLYVTIKIPRFSPLYYPSLMPFPNGQNQEKK